MSKDKVETGDSLHVYTCIHTCTHTQVTKVGEALELPGTKFREKQTRKRPSQDLLGQEVALSVLFLGKLRLMFKWCPCLYRALTCVASFCL